MPYSPRWYTLLHSGNPGDIEYYLRICDSAADVLELGAGVGRITMPLLASGLRVTALDCSEPMVAQLSSSASRLPSEVRRRLRVVQADMRELSLDRRFDRILIPYNSLLCLLSEADVSRCFTAAAKHLRPDGLLVFDIYDVPAEAIAEPMTDDDGFSFVTRIEDGGLTAHVYERHLSQPDRRRFDIRYRYEIVETVSGEMVEQFEYDIEQRCLLKEELHDLLGRAGLQIRSVTGDFEDAPVTPDTLQVVVVAGH